MKVAKLSAPPKLEVRFVSCNESETVFSLTHELFMTKHHTVTLINCIVDYDKSANNNFYILINQNRNTDNHW